MFMCVICLFLFAVCPLLGVVQLIDWLIVRALTRKTRHWLGRLTGLGKSTSRPKLSARRFASPEVPGAGGLKTPDVSYISGAGTWDPWVGSPALLITWPPSNPQVRESFESKSEVGSKKKLAQSDSLPIFGMFWERKLSQVEQWTVPLAARGVAWNSQWATLRHCCRGSEDRRPPAVLRLLPSKNVASYLSSVLIYRITPSS